MPRLYLTLRLLGLWLAFFASVEARALEYRCEHQFAGFGLSRQPRDSSVELEMYMNPELMNIFTTHDGTLGPVLGRLAPPDWLAKKLQGAKPREFPWSKLNFLEKKKLILYAAGKRKQYFFDNRTIQGLKVKDKLRIHFSQPVNFLGKSYPAGSHLIDTKSVLGSKVEFGNIKAVENLGAVELHFRSNVSAGALSKDAWLFQGGIQTAPMHQHVHIVADMPVEKLKADPYLASLEMADFHRRVNLLASVQRVLGEASIPTIKEKDITYFDSMSRETLDGITKYFHGIGAKKGAPPEIGDDYKMGLAGMRGSDKYDQPGLWGIEYRDIHPGLHSPDLVTNTLEAIQRSMTKQEYGVDRERLRAWGKKFQKGKKPDAGAALSSAWYNMPDEKIFDELPADLAGLLTPQVKEAVTAGLKHHQEAKMLFFDWSLDPLFFDRPDLLARIEKAQKSAVKKIASELRQFKDHYATPSDMNSLINTTVQDFLKNSGIAKEVSESLHLNLRYL
jgi:hypothetical protein